MTDETVLVLGNLEIPIGSGRELTQTLRPIDNGELRRTINGTLHDLTREQNRKYESQISGNGQSIIATPAIAELWKGSVVVVSCISKLRQNVNPAVSVITLIRTPVSGTVVGITSAGDEIDPVSVIGYEATFGENVIMVEFRPLLSMMVASTSWDDDEYAAQEGWSIDLEEV